MIHDMSAELDALSDKELHDRAFARAVKHLDLGFFKRVLEAAPAAHAAAGETDEAFNDVLRSSSLLTELIHSDPTVLAGLRPLYIEYLTAHS